MEIGPTVQREPSDWLPRGGHADLFGAGADALKTRPVKAKMEDLDAACRWAGIRYATTLQLLASR